MYTGRPGRVKASVSFLVSNRYFFAMGRSQELELLERISNLLRNETRAAAQAAGLQPVQLDVLDYLERCNRYSDTPAAVTEFLGLTKGTVSQSILRLEEKGLVRREADEEDGRVSRLELTAAGRREARAVWRRPLEQAMERALDGRPNLGEQLETVLRAFQRSNAHRSFGVCRTCKFFERLGPKSFRCGLTQERLSVRDSGLLCREHEDAKPTHSPES